MSGNGKAWRKRVAVAGMTGMGAAPGSALGLEAGQQAAASSALPAPRGKPVLHCSRKRKQGRVLGWEGVSLPTHPCLTKERPMQ